MSILEELKIQREGMLRYASCVEEIPSAQERVRELSYELEKLSRSFSKENKEVEKLKKPGIQGICLKMSGKYDARMDKEALEAANAKANLQNKQFEVEDAKLRLQQLQEDEVKYCGCEEKYIEMYKDRLEELLSKEDATREAIVGLQDKCSESLYLIKKLGKASLAGEQVLSKLTEVQDNLNWLSDFRVWHPVGNSLYQETGKRNHLDEAMENLEELKELMDDFRTECTYVELSMEIETTGRAFSDYRYMFDEEFFLNLDIQNEINNSIESLAAEREKAEDIACYVKQLWEDENDTLEEYEDQIENIVINA